MISFSVQRASFLCFFLSTWFQFRTSDRTTAAVVSNTSAHRGDELSSKCSSIRAGLSAAKRWSSLIPQVAAEAPPPPQSGWAEPNTAKCWRAWRSGEVKDTKWRMTDEEDRHKNNRKDLNAAALIFKCVWAELENSRISLVRACVAGKLPSWSLVYT